MSERVRGSLRSEIDFMVKCLSIYFRNFISPFSPFNPADVYFLFLDTKEELSQFQKVISLIRSCSNALPYDSSRGPFSVLFLSQLNPRKNGNDSQSIDFICVD